VCHESASLYAVWEKAPVRLRTNLLRQPCGVVCPSCGARLRIMQTHRIRAWIALLLGPVSLVAAYELIYYPDVTLLDALPWLLPIGYLLAVLCARRLVFLRPLRDGAEALFPAAAGVHPADAGRSRRDWPSTGANGVVGSAQTCSAVAAGRSRPPVSAVSCAEPAA